MENSKAVQGFLDKGGKIKTIKEGKTSNDGFNSLKNCTCGCNGNYTEHSMRLGERGICYNG